jgi:hypothetical protein
LKKEQGLGFEEKDVLVRYLLGDLPQADRERLEKEFLARDQAWEALSEVENDLIDSYARGNLSAKQNRQFEENFLNSAQRQEQLSVARILMDSAVREHVETVPIRSPKKSFWSRESVSPFLFKLAPLAAGVALVAALVLGLQNWRLQSEVKTAHLEQTQLQHQLDTLQHQLNNPRGTPGSNDQDQSQVAKLGPPALSSVSKLLTPGLSRQPDSGNPGNRLTIPAGTAVVTLRLDLERDPYPYYDVVVETVDGTRIHGAKRLASQPTHNDGRCVAVQLPSRVLATGDYIVTLYGHATSGESPVVESYSLSVVR